jgi:hypothetical protein
MILRQTDSVGFVVFREIELRFRVALERALKQAFTQRLLGAADTSGARQKPTAVDMGAARITAKTPRSITEVLLRVFREIA